MNDLFGQWFALSLKAINDARGDGFASIRYTLQSNDLIAAQCGQGIEFVQHNLDRLTTGVWE
jgi:hypothetical protein